LHTHATGGRRFESANDLDERAFAATARSEQAREASGVKVVGEAVKRLYLGLPLPPDLRQLLDDNIHGE
jgi:hypothetical protein